jgi:prolyl oligopeptidase PreP (S9A serine peptidase family)
VQSDEETGTDGVTADTSYGGYSVRPQKGPKRLSPKRLEEFHKPFFHYEIIEDGHNTGANLKESAQTMAMDYTYLTRKLMG